MKAIFYHGQPFFLTHGGAQTLTESLMREIAALGVQVEPARWWDDRQRGDILHFMNRPSSALVEGARRNGFKSVLTENMDQTSSRPALALWLRHFILQCDRSTG